MGSNLQAKLIKKLESAGCYVINVVAASKNGVPDIVGCSPNGRFFAIESKDKGDRLSKLQIHNMVRVVECGGIAIVAKSCVDLEMLLAGES